MNIILNQEQQALLEQLNTNLNPIQRAWLSGYFAAGALDQSLPVSTQPVASAAEVVILYGSHTGNGEGLAAQLAERVQSQGVAARVCSTGKFKAQDLKKTQWLILIVSTHGDGDPPEDAEALYAFVKGKKAPPLEQLKYSILALGDSTYEFFCQTGKDFDKYLSKLGAKSFTDTVECDIDFEEPAEQWMNKVIDVLSKEAKTSQTTTAAPAATSAPSVVYNRKNPFIGKLITNQKITGRDSIKDVRHIEVDISGSGIIYTPGDALAVWFSNDSELVKEIISLTDIDPTTEVTYQKRTQTIEYFLTNNIELTKLHPGALTKYAKFANNSTLNTLIESPEKVREYANWHQLAELFTDFPAKLSADDLISLVRPLMPRQYSVSSSQSEYEDEVHLTVGVVEYEAKGKQRLGGASGFMTQRVPEDGDIRVYIDVNKGFRLPEDNNTPIIMVGPGTGIAPFRAFLQERAQRSAQGKNWLFFGNPHFTQDFHYQTELQDYLEQGLLTQLDVAFSRDQAQKVYVQHKMLAQAEQIYQWLEDGAYFYVCGDSNHMAKDVHQALIQIVKTQAQLDDASAEDYLTQLRKQKRYQKDVY